MKRWKTILAAVISCLLPALHVQAGNYVIVDTGQTGSYDDNGNAISPSPGQPFYGQDVQHLGNQPSYTLSADGLTVPDNVTGLTWTKSADWTGNGVIGTNDKFTYDSAQDDIGL